MSDAVGRADVKSELREVLPTMTEVLSNQNDKKQFELFCSNEKQIDEKQFELCMATLRRMRTVLSANIVPSELDFVSPTFF